MFFNKIIKNLSIKNFLAASILISSVAVSQNSEAFSFKKQEGPGLLKKAAIITVIVGTTGLLFAELFKLVNYIGEKIVAKIEESAAENAPAQNEILKIFHENPNRRYEDLKADARNLHQRQTSDSLTSLDSDYPVIWLEKEANKNKYYLTDHQDENLKRLSDELNEHITFLINDPEYQREKIDYNEKYRTQEYRNSETRRRIFKDIFEK
jgi:hypothetical protein